jgi:hypothetical protein
MFISTIDFGGAAQLTAAGTTDAYILALDPTDGKTKAQTQVGGTQSSVGLPHVAIDDIGNVAFSAYYGGIGFTLAGTSLPASVGQDFSSIVAKFPASLAAPAYAKVSASAPDDAGNSSGIRAWSIKTSKTTGESLVAGSFSSSGDVGDGKTTTRTVGGNGYLLRRAR